MFLTAIELADRVLSIPANGIFQNLVVVERAVAEGVVDSVSQSSAARSTKMATIDDFQDQLLAMKAAGKTHPEMLSWLGTKGVDTSLVAALKTGVFARKPPSQPRTSLSPRLRTCILMNGISQMNRSLDAVQMKLVTDQRQTK